MKFFGAVVVVLMIGGFLPMAPSAARAGQGTVLTVGQGGTHATIQAAIDAALTSFDGSPVEIRVAAGTYPENVSIPASMNDGGILLSGGWAAGFETRSPDPASTTVDGGEQGRVFDLRPSGGEVIVDGFTITRGRAAGYGGGLSVQPTGSATVTVRNNRIEHNSVTGTGDASATGGGVYVYTPGTSRVFVDDNVISDNRCDAVDGPASGAGVRIDASQNGIFFARNNRIESNRLTSSGNQCTGAGLFLLVYSVGSGEFSGNLVRDNWTGSGSVVGGAAAIWMGSDATGRVTARRNRWVDNVMNGLDSDLSLVASNTGVILFTDSVVAGGKSVGMRADARDNSAIYLTNLTITGNQNRGLFVDPDTGKTTLYNSILYDNGIATDLSSVDASNNLIDTDPRFVDAAGRDFRLEVSSPAVNAGMNNPPGGLGPSDLDGLDRVVFGTVDIGACELAEPDFAVGFAQTTVTAHRGATVKVVVNVDRLGGFAGNVTVTPPNLSGIGVKVKPAHPKSTTGASVSFKLKIKGSATTGPQQIVFSARDDAARERTATLTLVIE